jgi:hypothetical protein
VSSALISFVVAGLDCGQRFLHDTAATMVGDAMGCARKVLLRNEPGIDSVVYHDCDPCYASGVPAAICCGMGCDQETSQRSETGCGLVTLNGVVPVRFESIHLS